MTSFIASVINEKLNDFYQQGIPPFFPRDIDLGEPLTPARGNLVKVIVGVRRSGKTYRLYQEMQRLLDMGQAPQSMLYFNFDDERLKPYSTSLLNEVIESYYAKYPEAKSNGAYFFFDEIQEVPDWGTFLRRLVDTESVTIYVTGSSSKMLSIDIATEFRGRALSREMYPMSFSEFIRYHDLGVYPAKVSNINDLSSKDIATLRNACSKYLAKGGFIPCQFLETSDAIQLLQEFANRAVNYDIIERYSISNPQAAALFLARAIASSGREFSINKISNELKSRGVSVSREMLSRLLTYYEEAFLLFSIRDYSRTLSDNPRTVAKIYSVDPAMFGAFSPASSTDLGQRLETAVFNKLKRESNSLRPGFISRSLITESGKKCEVDFVVGDATQEEDVSLIQVSVDINDDKTRARELSALEAAMKRFGTNESTLITLDDRDKIKLSNGIVSVVPAWHWLLS